MFDVDGPPSAQPPRSCRATVRHRSARSVRSSPGSATPSCRRPARPPTGRRWCPTSGGPPGCCRGVGNVFRRVGWDTIAVYPGLDDHVRRTRLHEGRHTTVDVPRLTMAVPDTVLVCPPRCARRPRPAHWRTTSDVGPPHGEMARCRGVGHGGSSTGRSAGRHTTDTGDLHPPHDPCDRGPGIRLIRAALGPGRTPGSTSSTALLRDPMPKTQAAG